MSNFLPYSLPDIGPDEISEVVDSLQSGWVTTGPKTKKFEAAFSAYIGKGEAIAVNSATAGLHLALEALGVGPGDEVLVPTYTFTATAEVVRYLGATPIFVDSALSDFNIAIDEISLYLTPKTKAIIPVHFAGLACNMEVIWEIAKLNNLKVVEDAAHALPTTFKGELIGAGRSDAVVYSFYANKTMTTGEGGMIITRDSEIAQRCRVMRLHGISRDAFDRYVSEKPSWFYEVVAPGYKYNMSDIAASIGLHQLKRLDSFHEKREKLAKVYNEELKELPIILPKNPEMGERHGRHIYPLRVASDSKISRDEFISLMHGRGIGCSVHFIPLHIHPYWKNYGALRDDMFPNATLLFEEEVSIPLYTKMTEVDQERVIHAIRSIFS